jgi:hypothetical protein|tara:strand:+ start:1199 stop:1651 length:453 start_codon:yes stop_codon:yes gene_type:complete
MSDTSESEINYERREPGRIYPDNETTAHLWHVMKHHTPWGPEWYMLDAQNSVYGSRPVPLNWRDKYREGLEGCIITFHLTDARWDDDVAREAEANQRLIMNAPRLYAEVKRLYEMMDVLASFNIVKNVEQGFTQREWVELVESVKRGKEE